MCGDVHRRGAPAELEAPTETTERKCPACGGRNLFLISPPVETGSVLCGCSHTAPEQYECLDCGEQFWLRQS
jgi:uncharacterized protein with PIN domain